MKGMQKISRGNGFKGVLAYAFGGEKREAGHGRLIGGNLASSGIHSLAAEFRAIAARRSDIEKPVWHNSLRMPVGEDISDERWNAVGKSYLKRMGFDLKNTQFVLVKHPDEHVHVIVNRVLIDGTVFLGQNENLKSTRVIGQLEKAFKLTLTPGPTYDADGKIVMPEKSGPKKAEIEQALRTGTKPARLVLQEQVTLAMAGRPTMLAFLERLDAAGITTIPNIAGTGTMNGFSFEWAGVAFSGSKLGAIFKWEALQQSIIYDKVTDSPELARRHTEARHRRAVQPIADPNVESVESNRGLAASGRNAANADFPTSSGDSAAGTSDARGGAAAAVLADAGAGQEAQGDRVAAAAQPGRENDGAGQSDDHADGVEGDQGRGEKLGRIEAIGVLQEVGELAIHHDEGIKIQAWRVQSMALGAPTYRLTLKDGLRPLGRERVDTLGQGKNGQPATSYSADQVESLIPALRLSNQSGFDIYLTPLDPAHHHLVVNGLKPAGLMALRAEGYMPALVQKSSENDLQVVMKVARDAEQKNEQGLVDAVELEFNQRFGNKSTSDAGPVLPMAGFTQHQTPAKKSMLTVVLDSLGQMCRKTWTRLVALRKQSDQDIAADATAQKRELEKGLRAARLFQFEMDAQTYRHYAAETQGKSPDQIDAAVAGDMLKEDYSSDQVVAVLRTSPNLAGRHVDIDLYVNDLVQRAQGAWEIDEARMQALRGSDIPKA